MRPWVGKKVKKYYGGLIFLTERRRDRNYKASIDLRSLEVGFERILKGSSLSTLAQVKKGMVVERLGKGMRSEKAV